MPRFVIVTQQLGTNCVTQVNMQSWSCSEGMLIQQGIAAAVVKGWRVLQAAAVVKWGGYCSCSC